ncbi:unnamed protein product [Psylliodes chrysocephalus]|uniref:E3 ubiquitin-protein ligase Topors n=1 Tax=Psylliodes chrysocephalus TaxID=3402493 RepID=A0A9P0D8W5_9CUCU|nr:unnamed protein product [Psylliodes chrysocephala]
MAESKVIVRCPSSSSPPPNCAICLGAFSNKCFSDSCMHQFCFKCLLEWSKIKPECPLCKQPFTRIIHNVKSNEEYDEHVVEITPPEEVHIIDNEEYLYLPLGQPQQSTRHHFHFRTTFTVDTHGEHAIQQMLLTHPQISVSTSGYAPPRNIYHRRRREPSTTTSFRRSVYIRNLWVIAPPDVTGRYRDVSPSFFRSFPAARTRLVPWLNRELNAILYENTQLVMRLVDIIMDHLLHRHICSRAFRNLLFEYLDNKTDHFIHEFFNFMRSPFDMVGYDRHVIYSDRPQSPHVVSVPDDISESGNDSDVIIVGSSNSHEPVVIDLVESDSDEPIIVPDDSPLPALIPITVNSPEPERETRTPVMPLKLRLKHKRRSREEEREKRYKKRSRRYRSSSSSSESFVKSTERHRRKKKLKKMKRRPVSSTESYSPDSDSDIPLSLLLNKRRLKLRHKALNINNFIKSPTKDSSENDQDLSNDINLPSCSKYNPELNGGGGSSSSSSRLPNLRSSCIKEEPPTIPEAPTCSRYTYTPQISSTSGGINGNESSDEEYVHRPQVKSEIKRIKTEPHVKSSKSSERLRNIMIKKENSSNTWYAYQRDYDSSDNEGFENSKPVI